MMKKLTIKRARELLDYDPISGKFSRKITRGSRWIAGQVVGDKPTTAGYGTIRIDGCLYFSHRIAWFLHYGKWPNRQVDHINMDKTDNRIANLRMATMAQNRMNERKKKTNTSGFKGVSWNKGKKKWEARIGYLMKSVFVGYFDTAESAHVEWCKRATLLHGEFARFE